MRELGQRSLRDGAALLVAVLMHAAALLVVVRFGRTQALTAPVRVVFDPEADALDVDLLSLAPGESQLRTDAASVVNPANPERVAVPATVPARGAVRAGGAVRASGSSPLANAASESDVEAAVAADSAAEAPAASPAGAASGSPTLKPLDLGIGEDGWKRWLSADRTAAPRTERAPATPIVRAAPASSTGGLVEGLREADRQRLVGPSGRVVNALEDAAHGDGSTAFGVARFAVTVLRSGSVEVRLENATAGEAEWRRVAERAAQNLRANAPPIQPPNEGARFVIDLSAEMLFPDGTHVAELYGPRVEAKLPRIHSWQGGQKEVLLKNPTAASGLSRTDQAAAIVELPGVYLAQRGKVCSYRFGMSVLGPLLQGGCELSNLGTKAQRVVHAHVSGSELF